MKAFISRRDFLKAAGITAAAAALAGCSSSGGSASGSSAGGKTIKIGVFEPASGDNGAGGKQEVLGVEYANSLAPTVEIGGETYNVELVEVDNQSSTDKAVTAAQELVSKKVSIVLGSYGSGVSIAAAPTFQSASIPAIGCSCTNPAVTEANPYYFRVCFLDPFQGSVMANFAKDEFSAANAYVLSMLGEDYGSGLASWATCLRYGWDFREASPLEQVKKCRLPMLFIHGTEDTFVPTWMGDSLYAAKTGIKEIWHVEGATHADSYLKYAKEYTEIVKSFVERYNIPKDMNNLPSQ